MDSFPRKTVIMVIAFAMAISPALFSFSESTSSLKVGEEKEVDEILESDPIKENTGTAIQEEMSDEKAVEEDA